MAAASVGGVPAEVRAVVAAAGQPAAEALLAADALVGAVGAVADAVAEAAHVDAPPLPLGVALHVRVLALAVLRFFRTAFLIFESKYDLGFRSRPIHVI